MKAIKINRQQVYNKYNGHCAYCGCELTLKSMQVDHIVSRAYYFYHELGMKGYEEKPSYNIDDYENLNPSCMSCNKRKESTDLETFRRALEHCPQSMLSTNANFKQMVRYGQIRLVNDGKIEFYFEKFKNE